MRAWLQHNGLTAVICLLLLALPVGAGWWHERSTTAPATSPTDVGTVADPETSQIVADPTNRSTDELSQAINQQTGLAVTVTWSLQAYPRWYVVTATQADDSSNPAQFLFYDDPVKGLILEAGPGTGFDYDELIDQGVPSAAAEVLSD